MYYDQSYFDNHLFDWVMFVHVSPLVTLKLPLRRCIDTESHGRSLNR